MLDLHRAQAAVAGPMQETSLQYLAMNGGDRAEGEHARAALLDLHRSRAFVQGPMQETSLQYLAMNGKR